VVGVATFSGDDRERFLETIFQCDPPAKGIVARSPRELSYKKGRLATNFKRFAHYLGW